jgi:hypothetical protein
MAQHRPQALPCVIKSQAQPVNAVVSSSQCARDHALEVRPSRRSDRQRRTKGSSRVYVAGTSSGASIRLASFDVHLHRPAPGHSSAGKEHDDAEGLIGRRLAGRTYVAAPRMSCPGSGRRADSCSTSLWGSSRPEARPTLVREDRIVHRPGRFEIGRDAVPRATWAKQRQALPSFGRE